MSDLTHVTTVEDLRRLISSSGRRPSAETRAKEIAQELRKTPRTAKIPIILITAYPSDQLLESGLRKGIALTLPKPIDLNRLLTLVRFAE